MRESRLDVAATTAAKSLNLFSDCYRGRRVLVTGHTGFKGSWLALWLSELGAGVTGVALAPETVPNHWDLLGLDMKDIRSDIRISEAMIRVVAEVEPEIVFHLAAQPLVRRSYRDPLETWSTNVMGTVNLLDACRRTASVRAIVVVTSDKCYENVEREYAYREADRLGAHDPYSASKAATELVAASYRKSFFASTNTALLATARAGNVIGGGDWCEDRLIPDLVRAMTDGTSLEIRSPNATRPWQHVLESLSGYLVLGQRLLGEQRACADAFNFGPDATERSSVSDVLGRLNAHWPGLKWHVAQEPQPHEASLLRLDSRKAAQQLGWRPVWDLDEALRQTADWYRAHLETGEVRSRAQLAAFTAAARARGLAWTGA